MTSKTTNPYAKSRHQWVKTFQKESTGQDPCQRFREKADPSVVVHCDSETGLLILSEKYHTGSVESLINNNRALFWQAIGWEKCAPRLKNKLKFREGIAIGTLHASPLLH